MNMNRIFSILAGAAVGLTSLTASAQIPAKIHFTFTVLTQGASRDNNTKTVTAAPKLSLLTDRIVLQRLANDFNGGTNFPAGSALVFDGTTLSVQDRAGNVLVADTSSVLSVQAVTNIVYNGSVMDSGLPPFSVTGRDYLTMTFDETGAGGTMKFTVSGLGRLTVSASAANRRTGNSHEVETGSAKLSGYGVNSTGSPITLSGTLTAAGAGAVSLAAQ